MTVTPAQLRAARGMIDWTRSKLAKASGISAETIKNIEHGIYTPQEATIDSIVAAFAEHDLVFMENEGIQRLKNRVRVFSGKRGHADFLDHVYGVMEKNRGQICQFNLSDAAHLPYAGDSAREHLKRMSLVEGLRARVLVPEGDRSFPASYCQYRWLDRQAQKLIPYYIYSDYVSLVLVKNEQYMETVSIHSKLLAEKYTEQFDLFWETAKTPSRAGQ
ncbi:MAG: helix-turn-helix domain-containing protein [Bdellovibrionales bacterium]